MEGQACAYPGAMTPSVPAEIPYRFYFMLYGMYLKSNMSVCLLLMYFLRFHKDEPLLGVKIVLKWNNC